MFNYEFGLAHITTADTVKRNKRKMEKKNTYMNLLFVDLV